jgi:hypothetical protein
MPRIIEQHLETGRVAITTIHKNKNYEQNKSIGRME